MKKNNKNYIYDPNFVREKTENFICIAYIGGKRGKPTEINLDNGIEIGFNFPYNFLDFSFFPRNVFLIIRKI